MRTLVATALGALVLSGCSASVGEAAPAAPAPRSAPPSASPAPVVEDSVVEESVVASPSPTAAPIPREPRRSFVSVPALGLVDVPVVRYRGTPDDDPGTAIQDRGLMASPRGTGGLVGPGEPGNFLVTGHRTSHGAPLVDLPALRPGAEVRVRTGDVVHVYEVTTTRTTSFRSPRSLRQQSAAVPGRPGAAAGAAYLTLSTCRTPEDRAEGNWWSDEHGNPEHRIDKIAVLRDTRPARS